MNMWAIKKNRRSTSFNQTNRLTMRLWNQSNAALPTECLTRIGLSNS
jgi:hypothetical protein